MRTLNAAATPSCTGEVYQQPSTRHAMFADPYSNRCAYLSGHPLIGVNAHTRLRTLLDQVVVARLSCSSWVWVSVPSNPTDR
jgi:hypothetical protein